MKNSLFIILFTGLTFLSNAQDSTIALSKFEKMATKQGSFCRFDEMIIGSVRNENITIVKIKNISNDSTLSVVRVSAEPFNSNSVPVISNSNLYFEKEDIEGVLKILEYYSNETKNQEPRYSPYFSYVTTTDVQVLCKYEERFFTNSYLTICKLYQYLRSPVVFSTIAFNRKDTDRFIQLLQLAAKELVK